jgi:asparagine synthase (glutamine-hydrolysing)
MHANDAVAEYARLYFDRDHDEMSEAIMPRFMNGDYSHDFVETFFSKLGDASPVDKALRLDTKILLIDDPGEARRQHDNGVGPGGARALWNSPCGFRPT